MSSTQLGRGVPEWSRLLFDHRFGSLKDRVSSAPSLCGGHNGTDKNFIPPYYSLHFLPA